MIGRPAVGRLIDAIGDQRPKCREAAVMLLRRIGDHGAFEPLVDALNDSNGSVQCEAVWALRSFEDPARSSLLPRSWKTGAKRSIRDDARRGRWACSRPLERSRCWRILSGTRKSEPGFDSTRRWHLGRPTFPGDERPAIQDRPSESYSATGCMVGFGAHQRSPRAADAMAALKNREETTQIRRAAAIGLGRCRNPVATERLLSTVDDQTENVDVRRSIIAALAFTGDARALARLFAELEVKDSELDYAAALALPCIEDASASVPLVKSLKNEHPYVRRFAAKALGN